jgi:hypothetical protein
MSFRGAFSCRLPWNLTADLWLDVVAAFRRFAGTYWPPVLAWMLVWLVGLPAVWNSHWMWIDDQMVVGQQLWPPDSSIKPKLARGGSRVYRAWCVLQLLVDDFSAAAIPVLSS